jgi:hypothetical protein
MIVSISIKGDCSIMSMSNFKWVSEIQSQMWSLMAILDPPENGNIKSKTLEMPQATIVK